MFVYFDRDQHSLTQEMGRYHPWTVTLGTPGGRYYDFNADPARSSVTAPPRRSKLMISTCVL